MTHITSDLYSPKEEATLGKVTSMLEPESPPSVHHGVVADQEVFKKNTDGVDFRTVGWVKATSIFLKIIFAVGVLSIPRTMSRHYWGCNWGLKALSGHAACTVWWSLIACVVIACSASIRKLEGVGWLTYAGFASIYIAVFIVVVGVTQQSRPAAAPQTGDFDLGFNLIAYPDFANGMIASSTIFFSSCATSAFLPVISEMRKPKDYRKALYTCMGIVTASYLCFSLVVYRYCGKWVASPSLGSAGSMVKMVAYDVGLLGLTVTGVIYVHIGAKYIFLRVLRNSRHLQSNTIIHWSTWLCCTFGLSALAFIFAEAIPIFNYLNALTGSLCFAPIAISLPGWLWIYDHPEYRTGTKKQTILYWAHAAMIPLGIFFAVGGTYGVVLQIVEAYKSGIIGSAFSCADNSKY